MPKKSKPTKKTKKARRAYHKNPNKLSAKTKRTVTLRALLAIAATKDKAVEGSRAAKKMRKVARAAIVAAQENPWI